MLRVLYFNYFFFKSKFLVGLELYNTAKHWTEFMQTLKSLSLKMFWRTYLNIFIKFISSRILTKLYTWTRLPSFFYIVHFLFSFRNHVFLNDKSVLVFTWPPTLDVLKLLKACIRVRRLWEPGPKLIQGLKWVCLALNKTFYFSDSTYNWSIEAAKLWMGFKTYIKHKSFGCWLQSVGLERWKQSNPQVGLLLATRLQPNQSPLLPPV